MKLEPRTLLKLFINFSDFEPPHFYKLYILIRKGMYSQHEQPIKHQACNGEAKRNHLHVHLHCFGYRQNEIEMVSRHT